MIEGLAKVGESGCEATWWKAILIDPTYIFIMSNGQEDRKQQADNAPGSAGSRTELAEDRTDWAHWRTVLANERTLSAWIRTGLAATAGGLAIVKLLGSLDHPLITGSIGAILIVAGGFMFVVGFWRYHAAYKKLEQKGLKISTPIRLIGVLIVGLLAAAVIAFVLLFINVRG